MSTLQDVFAFDNGVKGSLQDCEPGVSFLAEYSRRWSILRRLIGEEQQVFPDDLEKLSSNIELGSTAEESFIDLRGWYDEG